MKKIKAETIKNKIKESGLYQQTDDIKNKLKEMGVNYQTETIKNKIKESAIYQQTDDIKNKLKEIGANYPTEALKNKIKESTIYQQTDAFKNKLKKLRINRDLLHEIFDDLKREEMDTNIYKKPKYLERNNVIPKTIIKAKIPSSIISVKAILKISTHALKYANEAIPRNRWVEVIGILSGRLINNESVLLIENGYPMGHGNAIYAEISDYQSYIRAWRDIRAKGEFIVGWYHSHPSYSPFISDEDFGTHSRYQKLWDRAIALVIDPYEIDGTRLGFKIFRVNIQNKTWGPIPFKVRGNLDVKVLPEILSFIQPIIEGKTKF